MPGFPRSSYDAEPQQVGGKGANGEKRVRAASPSSLSPCSFVSKNTAHRRGISLYTSIFKLGLSWDYIKKAGKNTRFCLLFWLGWLDLNQRMTESEALKKP